MDEQNQGQDSVELVEMLVSSSRNMAGWVKFLGVITLISGIISALSIVGIIVAWVPIWLGVLLYQAGNRAEQAHLQNNPRELLIMLEKFRMYFMIQGILLIVMLGLSLIMIFGFGLSLAPMLKSMNF